MKQEKIIIKSKNGNKLACLVSKPDTKAEGLVVSSQGFGSTKNKPTYQFLLNELPKLGFIVVVFEFQGLGESEGKFEEKTETRDLEDLKAVVDYAYNSFEFDKEKFFVYGASFGGFTALNLTLEDNRIKGLVLKCPVSEFEKVYVSLREKRKYMMDFDNFYEDGKKYDVHSKASQIKIPIKIIHGDADITVSIEQSKKLASLLPDVELKTVKGANHNFEGHREELNSQTIRFFEELK
jgi:dipeptidyl aminopeptidase/acylaminoacyl peptidase